MAGRAELSVPPGFRFHPTEEELLYYYLKKKVSYEPIDLDVIREVHLNKLEPWDLKEKCVIGSGHQNDWYFFSHKDKKYPTGTRTNRATVAGFWKATGRDKAIYHSNSKRIGMRKTLVFYTGRAPRGHKTDWIMHEYRLDDDHHINTPHQEFQEDGWVVCRVFTKKNQTRSFQEQTPVNDNSIADGGCKHYHSDEAHYNQHTILDHNMSTSIHLPRLHSPESTVPASSHNIQLPSTAGGTASPEKYVSAGDWTFLDRLLAANQSMDHNNMTTKSHLHYFQPAVADLLPPSLSFPFPIDFHG